MKAYSNGKGKAVPERYEHAPGTMKGISALEKLLTRNYNRSLKKIERRNAKKDINQQL